MKLLSCAGGCGGTVYAENNIESATCDPCNGIFPVRVLEGDALDAFLAEQAATEKAALAADAKREKAQWAKAKQESDEQDAAVNEALRKQSDSAPAPKVVAKPTATKPAAVEKVAKK